MQRTCHGAVLLHLGIVTAAGAEASATAGTSSSNEMRVTIFADVIHTVFNVAKAGSRCRGLTRADRQLDVRASVQSMRQVPWKIQRSHQGATQKSKTPRRAVSRKFLVHAKS